MMWRTYDFVGLFYRSYTWSYFDYMYKEDDMKVFCVTLDGVLYDIFRRREDAEKRSEELGGTTFKDSPYRVETWEVEE